MFLPLLSDPDAFRAVRRGISRGPTFSRTAQRGQNGGGEKVPKLFRSPLSALGAAHDICGVGCEQRCRNDWGDGENSASFATGGRNNPLADTCSVLAPPPRDQNTESFSGLVGGDGEKI